MGIKYQQVSRQTPSDPYYEADQQRQLADALMQQANTPRNFGTATSGQANVMGLTQLAQAVLGAYAQKRAQASLDSADAATMQSNTTAIKQLIPDQVDSPGFDLKAAPGAHVDSVTGTDPEAQAKQAALESIFSGSDPRAVHGMLAQALAARAFPDPPKPAEAFTLGEGQVRYGPDGQQIAAGPAKVEQTRRDLKTRSVGNGYNQDFLIDPVTGAESKQGDPYKENPGKAQTLALANANGLTGDALTNAAEVYRQTRQLPNLGMGGAGMKVKIINKAAELSALAGDDASAASMKQQANKASQMALGQITKQKTVTGAFEKTALANLDLAAQKSADVARSGSPLFNRAIIAFKKGVTGDPATAQFVNALTAARNEYAKVLSSSTGAQGITDSARREAEELFSKVDSHEMLVATIGLAKQEMQNRMSGFDSQIAELNPGLSASTPQVAPAAAITKTINGKTYTQRDGKWYAD